MDTTKYVIKKGEFYWAVGDRGYSLHKKRAKHFTKEEAEEIVNRPYSDKTMHEL